MTTIKILHYDAFSSIPNNGNPAGVVIDATELHEDEMQRIAHRVGFNETVFVLPSDQADLRLRYYTPGHEINLCGHATIASLYALKSKGLLGNKTDLRIETNIGILPITFIQDEEQLVVQMKQGQPQFIPFNGDVTKLAEAMGLVQNDIDLSKPIVYGSTGTWTLIVFIKELDRFKHMKPDNKLFPEILIENSRASIHPVCLDTYDKKAHMHARHLSSPYSGTIEDPVTGTASGVMGAYYITFIHPELSSFDFIVEQGQEIGRNGRVGVHAVRTVNDQIDICIEGTAVFVQEIVVDY